MRKNRELRIVKLSVLGLLLAIIVLPTQAANTKEERTYAEIDSLFNEWYMLRENSSIGFLDTLPPVARSVEDEKSIEERITAIVSPIAYDYNKHVQRYVDTYSRWGKESVGKLLGRSRYFFPLFEEIFDMHDIPLEMKYLAVVESSLDPTAVSHLGASGIWQFMYRTGIHYGLKVSSYVDERRDPIQSTHAAAAYMKDMYEIYKDWNLVIASYNCGPGNVNKAIKKAGGKTDIWEIYPYLPKETRGYVPAFIAMTYFFRYHEELGYKVILPDEPLLVDRVEVSKRISLKEMAKNLGVGREQLEFLNAQYKRGIVPGTKSSPYMVKLPLKYTSASTGTQQSKEGQREESPHS